MTEDIANDVKADLEKALAEGELEESPLYVTRWNEESKKADVILGTFKEVWQRRIMVCPSLDPSVDHMRNALETAAAACAAYAGPIDTSKRRCKSYRTVIGISVFNGHFEVLSNGTGESR